MIILLGLVSAATYGMHVNLLQPSQFNLAMGIIFVVDLVIIGVVAKVTANGRRQISTD